eukprot:Protomagalhaensia_wolfi_Nauph_80__3394@NODE_344_length_2726_cov_121_614068_g260_i0_p1_GENE_NODE_344_length_2726_cov_121_614068_g260_i0NODE_344_length_2726_cov_121_614068_g260_i0_p1_ORF_typecomplete_len400_score46_79DSPc/PF00782_20/0_00016_NODE_344_length_2726_cov_121_614068_g260_i013232522
MAIKFREMRAAFRLCQNETAVAICSSRRVPPVRRRVVDPSAGILAPPPFESESQDQYDQDPDEEEELFVLPISKAGTRSVAPSANPGPPTSADYSIEMPPTDPETLIRRVSPITFLSQLQQKHRSPKSFLCIDLNPKNRPNGSGLKYAISPTVSVIADNVTNDVTILIGEYDESGLQTLLNSSPIKPKQVLVLDEKLSSFFKMYPMCHEESPYTMPGPTEILFRADTGFCLYIGDYRTAKLNVDVLQNVFDIRHVLNLSGQDLASYYTDKNILVTAIDRPFGTTRGDMYNSAIRSLWDLAKLGVPVLVVDASGCCHSPAVAALFLVTMGWSVEEAAYHVQCRRGGCPKRKELIDPLTKKAMLAYSRFRQSQRVLKEPPPLRVLTGIYTIDDPFDLDSSC